jgi:hypothetical protein
MPENSLPSSREVRTAIYDTFLRHYPSDGLRRACERFRDTPSMEAAHSILGAAALTLARRDAQLRAFDTSADFEGVATLFERGELAEEPGLS